MLPTLIAFTSVGCGVCCILYVVGCFCDWLRTERWFKKRKRLNR